MGDRDMGDVDGDFSLSFFLSLSRNIFKNEADHENLQFFQ